VARRAGASRATVSYVLNGRSDQSIPESTRRRVLDAAHELGHVPHAASRALRAGRSRLVLLINADVPWSTNITDAEDALTAAVAATGRLLVVWLGIVEITGTEGTLMIPDPNYFHGVVRITRPVTMANITDDPVWTSLPVPEATYGRGAGALDLARCIRGGGTPVASGALGYHVLDTKVAMEESMASGQAAAVTSTVAAIPLLPEDWNPYETTLR